MVWGCFTWTVLSPQTFPFLRVKGAISPCSPVPCGTAVRMGLPMNIKSWGFHMHERVSGNICPLVSWLQIVFPCSNWLCAIGIKASFRNGAVSVSCRAVGENGGGSRARATPRAFDDPSGKWHLKLSCASCTVLFCCQVCSGHWVPFAA